MRRKRAETRSTIPDPRYNSVVVAKFVNNLMERGKKSIATSIVYEAMDTMAERTKRPAMEVFEDALKNATPLVEVKPRRVGGATYQIPVEISSNRRMALGDALADRECAQAQWSRYGCPFGGRIDGCGTQRRQHGQEA